MLRFTEPKDPSEDERRFKELLKNYSSWIININRRLDEYHTNNVEDDGGSLGHIDQYPPGRFMSIQEDAFRPKLVSIGPCFAKDGYEMNNHKEQLLVRLLGDRKKKKKKKKSEEKLEDEISKGPVKLEDLIKSMNLLEEKTQGCYDSKYLVYAFDTFGDIVNRLDFRSSDISNREYIADWEQMMVIDGCFVIQVLRLHWQLTQHSSKADGAVVVEDPIFRSSSTIQNLERDFLVFGNQMPLFVLQELYSLTRSDENTTEPPLRCLAIHFLREIAGSEDVSLLEDDPRADECHHLLHLFSYACTNKPQRYLSLQDIVLGKKQQVCRGKKLTYNAKELQEAGVKIKPKQHSEEGLMAIDTFKGTTLRIQPFYLDNNVVFMLLNFLAFEQGHFREANPYFTSYIMFLDCLIDTEADVEILHKVGILNHAFGNNKDVADIIYKVTKELNDPDYNHFQREMTELNTYCKAYYGSKWRPWWRNLIRNYFSSPWTVTSLVAATILLILTFIQTFFATYAYFKPPN